MDAPIIKVSEIGEQYTATATLVGGFLLNFGIIEHHARFWVEALSTDKAVRFLAAKATLGERVNLIKKLVEWSDWKEERKTESLSLWTEILTFSETRNAIAHNPLLVTSENGKLLFRIAKKKKPKDFEDNELVFITLQDIQTQSLRVGEVIELLSKLIHQ